MVRQAVTRLARLDAGRWRISAKHLNGQTRHAFTAHLVVVAVIVALIAGLAIGLTVKAASRPAQEPELFLPAPVPSATATPGLTPMSSDPLPPHVASPSSGPAERVHALPSPVRAKVGQGLWRSIRATRYGYPSDGLIGHLTADGSVCCGVWVALNGPKLGSWVEVRYRGVTRTFQVRDRTGRGVYLDLTQRAAASLGFEAGTVEWRRVR